MAAPDLQTVLADPQFHALAPEEQRNVLKQIDPDFAGLAGPEQDKVLQHFSGVHQQTVADIARQRLASGQVSPGAPPDPFSTFDEFRKINPISRFGDTLASDINPVNIVKGAVHGIANLGTQEGEYAGSAEGERQAADEAIKQGNYGEGAKLYGKGIADIASSVPVAGPLVRQIVDHITNGRIPEALAHIVALKAMGDSPEVASEAIGGGRVTDGMAEQYAGAVGKKGTQINDEMVKLAPKLIQEGVTARSPQVLANVANKRATAIDVDSILKREAPDGLPTDDITQAIMDKAKKYQVPVSDPLTGSIKYVDKLPDTEARVAGLKGYRDLAQGASADNPFTGDTRISPDNVLALRRAWEETAGSRGYYKKTGQAVPAGQDVAMNAADAMRDQINNAGPETAAANSEKHFWLDVRDAANNSTRASYGLSDMGKDALLTGGTHFLFGARAAGVAITARILSRMMDSPWWRTTSPVLKVKIGTALQSGNVSAAAGLAAQAAEASQQGESQGESQP